MEVPTRANITNLKAASTEEANQSYQTESAFGKPCFDAAETDQLDITGVSVYHLKHVFLEQEVLASKDAAGVPLTRSSTIHSIEDLEGPAGVIRRKGFNVTCPLDGKKGAAYVHCLKGEDHVGQATHMLSYTWGYMIGDIVDTLAEYCSSKKMDPKRTYVWICCLCVNQHRVAEKATQEKSGVIEPSLFGKRVEKIRHILPMMAPWKDPLYLKRVWCIFELYTAGQNQCKMDIVMPPKQKQLLVEDLVGGDRGIDILYGALAKTNIQAAKAFAEKDRKMILERIESIPHGCTTLNKRVNELLRSWVRDSIVQLIDGRANTNDCEYATFCGRIGYVLAKNREVDEGLKLYRTALRIREGIQGKDHPDAATLYEKIGCALVDKGGYGEALQLHRKCLSIRISVLPNNHPDIADSHSNIGLMLAVAHDYRGALENHYECLAIRENSLGKQHPATATTYNNIGFVLKAMGDYDGALKNYHKCLAIQEDEHVLGTNHPSTALTHNNIGIVLHYLGNKDGALEHLYQCLAIQELVLGTEHPSTTSTYHSIGTVLYVHGDKEASMFWSRKALGAMAVPPTTVVMKPQP